MPQIMKMLFYLSMCSSVGAFTQHASRASQQHFAHPFTEAFTPQSRMATLARRSGRNADVIKPVPLRSQQKKTRLTPWAFFSQNRVPIMFGLAGVLVIVRLCLNQAKGNTAASKPGALSTEKELEHDYQQRAADTVKAQERVAAAEQALEQLKLNLPSDGKAAARELRAAKQRVFAEEIDLFQCALIVGRIGENRLHLAAEAAMIAAEKNAANRTGKTADGVLLKDQLSDITQRTKTITDKQLDESLEAYCRVIPNALKAVEQGYWEAKNIVKQYTVNAAKDDQKDGVSLAEAEQNVLEYEAIKLKLQEFLMRIRCREMDAQYKAILAASRALADSLNPLGSL